MCENGSLKYKNELNQLSLLDESEHNLTNAFEAFPISFLYFPLFRASMQNATALSTAISYKLLAVNLQEVPG